MERDLENKFHQFLFIEFFALNENIQKSFGNLY